MCCAPSANMTKSISIGRVVWKGAVQASAGMYLETIQQNMHKITGICKKVFTERGRLILMNVQISTSGCVLCVCGEKTVLPRKEIPKNTQDTTVNLS